MINDIVNGCTDWIKNNEFQDYRGSLRSLVRMYVMSERKFEYASMADVDSATNILQERMNRGKMQLKEVDKIKSDIPSLNCMACGGKVTIDADNLCYLCLKASKETYNEVEEW